MLRSYAVVLATVLLINNVLAAPDGVNDSSFEQQKTSLQAAIDTAKEKKDTTELIRLHQQLIESSEKVFGPESVEVATELKALGDAFYAAGKYDQALPLFRRALAILEKVLGPEHVRTAIALNNLAGLYKKLGQYDKALSLYERSLAIFEKVLGPEHDRTATRLNDLALLYKTLGQYDKVLPLYERSLAIRERVLGPEHDRTATALNNLAGLYKTLGQYDQVLPLYERSLAIREKVLGPEHDRTAIGLNNLAELYKTLGQYDKALPLYERSLGILEKVLGPEHDRTAIALNNLAGLYKTRGQYDKALPLYERSLAIFEKVLGPEHDRTATTLNDLALLYKTLGQYEKVLPLYERSLVIFEKVLGPEHDRTATTLNDLALLYKTLGQYEKALPLYERSLAIREKVLGPEHDRTAIALNNLAGLYKTLGQYDKALPLYERSLAIREKVLGPEHDSTALALNNLAQIHRISSQYDKALPLYERSLAIREKKLGPEHDRTAIALHNLAGLYTILEQYDKALPLYERSLAIFEKLLGPEHDRTATALNDQAGLYVTLGQYDKALPLYERSLAIREKVLGLNHPDTGSSYKNFGHFYLKQSLPDLAITFYKLAVNVRQSTRERVRQIGTAELESYTRSVETTYQDLAALLTEQGRLDEAQQVLELLKEDELFEFIRRSETKDLKRHKIQPTPTEQRWIAQYRAIADRLFALGQEEQALEKIPAGELTTTQRQRLAQIKADLKVAHQAFTRFMSELKNEAIASKIERSADVEQLSPTAQSETREILQALGDEVALVQYFITDTELNMLVTTTHTQKHYKSKVDTKDLNHKLYAFRGLLRDEQRRGNPQKLAEELYQWLFAPIAADLAQGGIRTVMISGDGALRYVPFAALHDGKDYLIARYALPTYTSVTRHNLKESSQSVWTGAGLGVTQAHHESKALPAVRDELYSIMGPVIPGEIYLDQAFTAERLRAVGRQRLPVVHIASHFTFSQGTELNSFLLLGDGSQLNLGAIRTGDYQFGGVDLLTLSACQTGLGFGRDEKGREIEGFGVIAQQKGAKSVIATLWKVEDTSTSMLMASVYRHRKTQGLTKIEALRQAQLSLQKQTRYAHPYFWAPFILMGNWR